MTSKGTLIIPGARRRDLDRGRGRKHSLRTERDAEPQIQVTAKWCACHAVSRTADPRGSFPKSSAAYHAAGYLFKRIFPHGIFGAQVPVRPVPVLAPLPRVAVHVTDPKPVRQESPNRRAEHVPILRRDRRIPLRELPFRVAVSHIGHLDERLRIITAEKSCCRPRPAPVLSLCLRRQSHCFLSPLREPVAEGVRVIP
jgi:hypothetical protein